IGHLDTEETRAALSRVHTTNNLVEAVAGGDHVIEAAPENFELKRALLDELDRITRPDVVLASTTSGLSITALAEACTHPERVLGTRYYPPAHLIPLVDVVPGKATSPEAVAATRQQLAAVHKVPAVHDDDGGGAIGPRLQGALVAEAFRIVRDGAGTPEMVDQALTQGLGRRFGSTGVFDRIDLAGLDTVAAVLTGQGRPVPATLQERLSAGHLGVKAGRGFYDWPPERAAQIERTLAQHLVDQLRRDRKPPFEKPTTAAPDVLLDMRLIEPFLTAAVAEYQGCTTEQPPSCFAVLVGQRAVPGHLQPTRVCFGRNVRAQDPVALTEFATNVVPCFGAAYANTRRGFWCDAGDLLRISREADADGLEILGSIHLHPDWHHIGPAHERGLRISHHPTPMDRYVLDRTGWPLNMICYLERSNGDIHHTLGAWNAQSQQLTIRTRMA
ncbi:MAG: 3-hydroxyacyl-CoA dehydrogenase NAD-binding domain-containing protein, partial [Micromonosporaceae bacterium]